MAKNSYTNVRIINVFSAYETVDEMGRKGEMVGCYSSQKNAEIAAAGRGWYGGPGTVEQDLALVIEVNGVDQVYPLKRKKDPMVNLDANLVQIKKEKIKVAKAKLTAEELELLGIKA